MMHVFKFTLVLLLFALLVQAQERVPSFLGTKTPYHPLQQQHTPPPAGFKPVFVNYVGRHGARFLTKPGSDVLLVNVLQQAAVQDGLTAVGKSVQQTLTEFEAAEKAQYENITLLGIEEQQGIAARMYEEYKPIFDGKQIDVFMTTKVRTQQSADAFLKGLPQQQKANVYKLILPDSTDVMLRFYDKSPAYDVYQKSKTMQQHLDSLQQDKRMNEVAARVCKKLFTTGFYQQIISKKISLGDKQKSIDAATITQALYEVYTIWFAAQKDIAQQNKNAVNHLADAFTQQDLQWLSLVNDAEDFYAKGPAEDKLGIQVRIAAPLLINFINTTDSVVHGLKQANAVFRFTHAEAISPFATLLGIPEANSECFSVYDIKKHWQAADIFPLSANIQWILYNRGKDYLLKVLLNEKEVKLPLPAAAFPYYNWPEARAYYINLLTKLGTGLGSDMNNYLLHTAVDVNK